MTRRLLVGVGKLEERSLRPGAAVEGHAGGKRAATAEAHGDIDRREARGRREELAVVPVRRVEVADQARRIAPGRIHESVELELAHGLQNGLADLFAISLVGVARGRAGTVLGPLIGHFEAALGGGVEGPGVDDVRNAFEREAVGVVGYW